MSEEEFSKNDLYLIRENYKNGKDDFLMLFAGDRQFIVPFSCTKDSRTDKQSICKFETQLFDFEDVECGKYNRNNKRIRWVEYEGRKFVVPFEHKGEINPKEIAKVALDRAEAKYNMVINAYRKLKELKIEVGDIEFYERSANKYAQKLIDARKPILLHESTSDMIEATRFLEGVNKNTKVIKGKVKRVQNDEGKQTQHIVNKEKDESREVKSKVVEPKKVKSDNSLVKEEGDKSVKTAKKFVNKKVDIDFDKALEEGEKIAKNAKKFANKIKKKIVETEFNSAKRFVTDNYKVAMLAVALTGGIGGGVYLGNKLSKEGDNETVQKMEENKENKIVQDGVYTTFDGRKLQDKYGNLEAINNLRKEITLMMIAVEGYSNKIFPDTRNNATGGIGTTASFDEDGKENKVSLSDADWSDKKVIVQKWRYMEKYMLPIIAGIDKKCSNEEILATLGAGFCWGPTNLRNSEYLKGLKKGDDVGVLTRKLTGFRNPSGLVKREYLLACLLEKKWDVNELNNMPVYYLKNKGFLHGAIYTLDFDDICPIKKDKKGNPILDKGHNQIPKPDKDGFCTLYLDRSDEVLDKILTPNARFGDYRTVEELLPKEALEYLKPDFCLSSLQENLTKLNKEKKSTIEYGEALAMLNNNGR